MANGDAGGELVRLADRWTETGRQLRAALKAGEFEEAQWLRVLYDELLIEMRAVEFTVPSGTG